MLSPRSPQILPPPAKAGRALSLKLVSCLLAVLLCAVPFLTACRDHRSHAKAPGSTIKIGILSYRSDDTFINALTAKITAGMRLREKTSGRKIALNIMSSNGDQNLQNNQVDRLLQQDYDVLCINLVDRTTASVIIQKCKRSKVPIVFFNREPVKEDMALWDKLYYVGTSAEDEGRLQGEILLNLVRKAMSKVDLNGDGILQYVMLEGETGHQDALLRTDSSVKVLTDADFVMDKLASDSADWDLSKAYSLMSSWLKRYSHGEIEVVFANNDDMALGAIHALDDLPASVYKGRYPIVLGIDGTPAGLEAIKEGKLYGSVVQDAVGLAAAICGLSLDLAENKPILPENYPNLKNRYCRVPNRVVTIANLGEELKKQEEVR